MDKLTRRDFVKSTMAAGAGLILASPNARVLGANNDIRVAVIGVGGQGSGHIGYFGGIPGVRLVALCDPDSAHAAKGAANAENRYKTKVKQVTDIRQILDDKEIDAVTIATPNHWHSLAVVWACQAGKDVYVEKPISHEVWEGRRAVEAARKYKRIVQAGTQKRSSEAHRAAYQWIREGNLGAIKWVRGFCYKARSSGNGLIPATNGPVSLPSTVDYNLWCGPADMEPLRRENLHYVWHWVWNTGNGDIGNQGVHEMDLARWALGDPGLPARVCSIGGRFGVNDVAETPNTLIAYYDYKPAPLIFEVRGLPAKKGMGRMDNFRGVGIGVVVQCEKGYFAAGDGGGWIWNNDGTRTDKQFAGGGGGSHHRNWISAVRSRKVEDLNADIEKGHLSSALCHLGNISYRLGQTMPAKQVKEVIKDNADMTDSVDRMLEHLKANELDAENTPITIGPMLTMDADKEMFTGEHSDWANMLIKRNYREPFIVPDKV